MPLDPQVEAYLREAAAAGLPPYHTMSPEQVRAALAARSARFLVDPPVVAGCEEREIPGPGGPLPLRIYTPAGRAPFPVLVHFHGGGWVAGNLDTHDSQCRGLANASGCLVVSVDYRLAPDHKFPAQMEDAYAAVSWVSENARAIGADASRLAVGGDSAGGNMSAAVCLMSRDRGGPPIACQLLIYPVTDYRFDTESYRDNAQGYGLTRGDMIWFWDHYLARDADGLDGYASPLRAESLAGLPPAIVVTAEYDPLRDDGEAYARRLEEAGVPVDLTRYPGVIHNFVRMFPILDQGKIALGQCGRRLAEILERSPR